LACSNRAHAIPIAGLVALGEDSAPDEDEVYAALQAPKTRGLVKRHSQSECGNVCVFWKLEPEAHQLLDRDRCSVCGDHGWIAYPTFADHVKTRILIRKVACPEYARWRTQMKKACWQPSRVTKRGPLNEKHDEFVARIRNRFRGCKLERAPGSALLSEFSRNN
jgi:hypothetical protein